MTNLESLDLAERSYQLTTKEGWTQRIADGPRTAPPQLTRKQLEGLARRDRLRYDEARKIWHANLGPIITPGMRQVFGELTELIDSNRQDGGRVKPAAVLDAWPGLGKTTLITAFSSKFHQDEIDLRGATTELGHERIPVAYLSLTSTTTMRTLNSMLCQFYGHPGAHRGNAQRLAERATTCVRDCQTRLIIIDDVHFLDMNRRNDREVANHFKWLSTQFPVTFIFVGVGIEERGLLTEGMDPLHLVRSQTARRWTKLGLEPFEVKTKRGRATWRSLLLGIEQGIRLVDSRAGMLADELPAYLYERSTGHFASLMALINRGCLRAMQTEAEHIDLALLDGIKADAAAEKSRRAVHQAFKSGQLGTVTNQQRQPA